jgi:hypothetical protein
MRRDEGLYVAPSIVGWRRGAPCEHHIHDLEQPLGYLEIALVAGVVERDQDFIGQPAGVPLRRGSGVIVGLGVTHVCHSLPP